jgi:FKBP-type peptidyl-prolyl cis-trans isomerase
MFVVLLDMIAATTATISLAPDDKVIKQLTHQGLGKRSPIGGNQVKIHYSGWLNDGTLFDSSRTRNIPLSFQVGHGVIRGWSIAVQSMVTGEQALFNIHWEYGYGESGYQPVIPPYSNLTFEIELIDIR